MRRQRGRIGLMAAALVGLVASGAAAEVTTERSASILVFPKGIADGTRDTIIKITNTSNSMVHAHCFYVNGGLTFPDQPPSPLNPPLWTEIDFDIWLTKQQPTYWLVSEGRLVNPADPSCSNQNQEVMAADACGAENEGCFGRRGFFECFNAGFDPGRVPPVVSDFTGELKCVEVDQSGAPLSGNHLKGEATLVTREVEDDVEIEGDVAKYNALGIIGLETNDGDGILCLGGEPDEECPNGAEYNACPQTWILNHLADGAEDPVVGEDSRVETDITVVPCAENFETQVPETVTIQFLLYNEYEQRFSTSTSVTCWAELNLSDIDLVFSREFVGTDWVQTRMRPSTGTNSGFLVVADETHYIDLDPPAQAAAAVNLHVEGERPGPDKIVIPAEQVQP